MCLEIQSVQDINCSEEQRFIFCGDLCEKFFVCGLAIGCAPEFEKDNLPAVEVGDVFSLIGRGPGGPGPYMFVFSLFHAPWGLKSARPLLLYCPVCYIYSKIHFGTW